MNSTKMCFLSEGPFRGEISLLLLSLAKKTGGGGGGLMWRGGRAARNELDRVES